MARYRKRGTVEHNPKSGRPRSVATAKVIYAIQEIVKKDPNKSVRVGADQVHISKSTYSRIKTNDLGVKAYRKEPAPKYSGDQKIRAKKDAEKFIGIDSYPTSRQFW